MQIGLSPYKPYSSPLSTSTRVEGPQGGDFPNRDGYDVDFLGPDLALPKLSPELEKQAAPLLSDPSETELKYTHFSVIMHKMRRLPILTAVNINGAELRSVPRNDRWVTDDRMSRDYQLGNEAYTNNDLDRGHMVRRLDPVWGEKAEQANSDTFVYTNCALQHKDLNRKEWVALEEHILNNARTTDKKMTVLTGPVFSSKDPIFDNGGRVSPPTHIPQQFWKVAVWNNGENALEGTAFVLSQAELIDTEDYRDGKFDPGRFDVYQVPMEQLEKMTQFATCVVARRGSWWEKAGNRFGHGSGSSHSQPSRSPLTLNSCQQMSCGALWL